MRIGFDAKRAFLNTSGLGNYSRNTIHAINESFPSHQLLLFTPETNNDLFSDYSEYEIVSPNKSASKLQKLIWRSYGIGKKLDNYNLDVFHGLSNELPGGIHKARVRSVVTIHDLIFIRYPEFYKPLDRKIYLRKVKYACETADKIIAISEQTKCDIIKFLNVPPEKIEVVYQSVSPVFYEKQNIENLRLKYGLPSKFILSVGTIEKRKNQISLLRAIHTDQIKLPVVFVGNHTKYLTLLQNLIAENKMESRVTFLKNVPEIDLAGLYQLASLSVYNSIFEGFGLPVIEAMASGCPVITSNVSCLPETAGNAALLCSPENHYEIRDHILKITEDDHFRKELIEKGKERALLFHPKKYAEKIISLYSKIQ